MTAGTPRPPRLARRLLDIVLPSDARDHVAGDVEELYRRRRREGSALGASLWFWGQAISLSVRFGAERLRDAFIRVAGPFAFSWIDVKLGLRMLVKSPLLTLTGAVAIATAIAINAGFHEFLGDMLSSRMQLPGDQRIVALVQEDLEDGGRESRLLADLARWREGLTTVEGLGAARSTRLNLVAPDGGSTPVDVAEVSASAFDLLGVVPAAGRVLQPADDGPGAEPVVVLGYDLWQRVFAGRRDVVGSAVQLGERQHTVVGVAPEGLRFPTGQEAWINFRLDPAAFAPRSGPGVIVFGRVVAGRTLDEARVELDQVGSRAAADAPEAYAQLRPRLGPFGQMFGLAGNPEVLWIVRGARLFFTLLLVAACATVAPLVFARNATRESEIAVRSALGAGRARIVSQLFAEAMVLALMAAGLGLVVADRGLRWGMDIFWRVQYTDPPFWFDAGLSLPTVLYSLVLAVLGAGVVGILPALGITRGGERATLQRVSTGTRALSFGALPTIVIVVQIAMSVALLPVVLTGVVADFKDNRVSVSFPTENLLTARLMVDSDILRAAEAEERAQGREPRHVTIAGVSDAYPIGDVLLERYDEMRQNVARRLRAEPGVRSVAFTTRRPAIIGQSIPSTRLEIAGEVNPERGRWTQTAHAEAGVFDMIGQTVVVGRPFTGADFTAGGVALVNQAFVQDVLGGSSPVGRLVRDFREDGDPARPWTEIVGVLADGSAGASALTRPQIYYPLTEVAVYPLKLLLQVDGDPAAFEPRLRAAVADAEPGLLVDEVYPLDEMRTNEMLSELFFVVTLLFVALVTLLLSTAGVYALMSFLVAQRTREIGIRTAVGAAPGRVVSGVFARALIQLGLGAGVGFAVVGLVMRNSVAEDATGDLLLAAGGVAAVLLVVGLIGCLIPLRRALRIQPMEALSAEG